LYALLGHKVNKIMIVFSSIVSAVLKSLEDNWQPV